MHMYGLWAPDAGDRAEKIYAIICATCTPSLLLSYVPCSFRFQQNNVVRGRRPNRYASGDTLLSYEAARFGIVVLRESVCLPLVLHMKAEVINIIRPSIFHSITSLGLGWDSGSRELESMVRQKSAHRQLLACIICGDAAAHSCIELLFWGPKTVSFLHALGDKFSYSIAPNVRTQYKRL